MPYKMNFVTIGMRHGGKFINKDGYTEHIRERVAYYNIHNIKIMSYNKL